MKSPAQDIMVSKGLDLDTHESLLPQNALAYLLNGDFQGHENSGNSLFIQNVMSNELCYKFPKDYEFLGAVRMDRQQYALFFKTPTSSEIGIFDSETCAYVSKVNNNCLNFENKITGVYKMLSGCNKRRVFWVEEGNPIRYIDIDDCLPVKDISDCFECEKNEVFDCDAFNLNRCVKFPEISLKEGVGNLPNGNYQIAIALTDDEMRFTEYLIYPEVVKFHTNNQAVNRFGIEVEFTSCPAGFEQYELVLISHRTDRGTLAQRVGYFDIKQTSLFIGEIDDPTFIPIDLSVMGQRFPKYQSAKGIAQNNEQLLLSGVTYREIPNYQPRANRIQSKWKEFKVRAEDAPKYLSYMRGEQYGFTIRGVYCDGERTPEYHIPSDAEERIVTGQGQEVFDNLFTPITNNDNCEDDDPCNELVVPGWQVYDSSTTDTVIDPLAQEHCFRATEGLFEYVDDVCAVVYPYEQFVREDRYIRIEVINQYCEPAPATQDISIKLIIQETDCAGVISIREEIRTIPAGESSAQLIYTAYREQECGAGECNPAYAVYQGFEIVESHLPECDEDIECLTRTECDEFVSKSGNFGYWESTLQYPNNPCVWGQREDPDGEFYHPFGLSCQKVRYHRFPDNKTTHIHDSSNCNDREFVNILGIEFSNIQPFVDKSGNPLPGIIGYEICVTDRANHKSILHKGMMYNMFEEKLSDCSTSYYANYPFNDLNSDPFLSKTPAEHSLSWFTDNVVDPSPFAEFNFNPVDTYSRTRFEYISPDVSYERNDAGQYLQLYSEENGPVAGKYSYTEEMPEVTVISDFAILTVSLVTAASALLLDLDGALQAGQAMLDGLLNSLRPEQYGINYYARTQYKSHNFERIAPGNQRRKINVAQYTLPTKMWIGDNKVNNFQRESGLFLELCTDLEDPFVAERSRIRFSDHCKTEFSFCEWTNYPQRPVTSSYYAGVKIERPNQYGLPGSVVTRMINGFYNWDNNSTISTGVIFGGDVHITKHKHIRKFPFFTNLPLDTPNKTMYRTRPYMNVWNSRYWFNPNNVTSVALMFPFPSIVSVAYTFNNDRNLEQTGVFKKVNCDNDGDSCSNDNEFKVDGTFYTHVVGEIEYWCESEYIGDFREFNEIPESDIERTVEEKIRYRTVQYPELYLYNRQYHWKGLSSYSPQADIDFECCKSNVLCSDNTLAYSLKNDPLRKGDAWTKFLPNSIQQFSSKDGALIGMREINDYDIMFFFEDGTYITQQDETLIAEGSRVFLGTADAFSRRLRKISDDYSGFGGCIDLDSVIPVRSGVYWFDRKRKKFCHYYNVVRDATGPIQSWLNENLVGEVHGVYDSFSDNIYYTGKGKNGNMWTLSYKLPQEGTQWQGGWVSFHSFTPEKYLIMDNNYISSNGLGLWKHNKPGDYQRYYNEVHPFNVGSVLKSGLKTTIPQHLEVYTEWIKYDGYGRKRYETDVFFDKMLAYNQLRTTGEKPLFLKDLNNMNHHGFQGSTNLIEVSRTDDFIFRLNKFATESTYQPSTVLEGMEITSTNVKNVADPNMEPLKGQWMKLHLINEKPEYKVLLQLNATNNEIQKV